MSSSEGGVWVGGTHKGSGGKSFQSLTLGDLRTSRLDDSQSLRDSPRAPIWVAAFLVHL